MSRAPAAPIRCWDERTITYPAASPAHPGSVLDFPGVTNAERLHSTQKPLDLMRWLVRSYSRPGDLVADPFAGRGTTVLAAALEGRRYFGCEKDPLLAIDGASFRAAGHC